MAEAGDKVFAETGRAGGTNGGGVTAFEGAGGTSGLATGGRAAPPLGGVNGAGAETVGGRAGKLIRTVSRFGAAAPLLPSPFPRGGKVIRTVSFFGSFESAIA